MIAAAVAVSLTVTKMTVLLFATGQSSWCYFCRLCDEQMSLPWKRSSLFLLGGQLQHLFFFAEKDCG